jgi:hypothetical protein
VQGTYTGVVDGPALWHAAEALDLYMHGHMH